MKIESVIVQELVTYKHITIEEKIIDGDEGLKEVKDAFGRVIARIATLKK